MTNVEREKERMRNAERERKGGTEINQKMTVRTDKRPRAACWRTRGEGGGKGDSPLHLSCVWASIGNVFIRLTVVLASGLHEAFFWDLVPRRRLFGSSFRSVPPAGDIGNSGDHGEKIGKKRRKN